METPSVEVVRVLMGWMESKQGPFSLTQTCWPQQLFSQKVLCQEGLKYTFSENTTPQASCWRHPFRPHFNSVNKAVSFSLGCFFPLPTKHVVTLVC